MEFREETSPSPTLCDPDKVEIDNATATDNIRTEIVAKNLDLWHDVFVERPLPWPRFAQSVALHAAAAALIWIVSASWLRQQKLLQRETLDKSALVTYTPDEYLPPLDTGKPEAAKTQKGDPVYAKQSIISVPRESDNRSQTIVAPPNLKLDREVPMPNIVAQAALVPAVPLDATRASTSRLVAPETRVVAPPPEVDLAPDRVVRAAMKSDVIAPPPELSSSAKGHASQMNIGPSDVVAPAPQLTLDEQHVLARGSGKARLEGGSQPVAPPPSIASSGGASGGRIIALGIHPVAPTGPVAPSGNRRGTFAATPKGKAGAAGTPDLTAGKSQAGSGVGSGSPPSGLHIGAGDGPGNAREMASLSGSNPPPGNHDEHIVSQDKLTDLDRQVFGEKLVHSMTLNMPNLNSSTGSWVIRFAELDESRKSGELTPPESKEKIDPGYPLDLIRSNVHGMVTLYAVIKPDGNVGSVRVLSSPDDRLDAYAAKALARCKFQPASREGKPVALEAVVIIPFRVRRNF